MRGSLGSVRVGFVHCAHRYRSGGGGEAQLLFAPFPMAFTQIYKSLCRLLQQESEDITRYIVTIYIAGAFECAWDRVPTIRVAISVEGA